MQQVAEAGRGAEEGSLRETRGNKSAFSGSGLCPNSALASHQPRGRGRREGEAVPTQCPRPGAIRAGAVRVQGGGDPLGLPASPAGPAWLRRICPRVGASPDGPGRGHLPVAPALGAPSRAVERPPGARQAPAAASSPYVSTASSRRRRCRTSLAALPSAGRGARRPAASLGTRRGRGPPAAGDMAGGPPPPSSGVSSRHPVVPLPPALRSPISHLPRARRPCLTRSATGLPSCAPLPSRSPAPALMSGTRLFPPCSFDAGARAASFPPAPSPRAVPPAPAHPPLPPASRGPAEFPASASPVACRLHLPQPCPDTTLAAPTPTGRAYPGETLPRPPASPPCPALRALFPRGPEVSPPLPPFDVEARLDAALPAPGLGCQRIRLRAWGAAGGGLCMPTSCSARAWATRWLLKSRGYDKSRRAKCVGRYQGA